RQDQMPTQLDRFGDARQRLAPHEMGMSASKIALGLVFKVPPQQIGDDETENAVAEEFQTLVAGLDGLATLTAAFSDERAGMGQGLLEELAASELVADNFRQIPPGHVNSSRGTGGCGGSR